MAPKSREELRKEMGERRVDPATFAGKAAVSLEDEAERIRHDIEIGQEEAPTPAQEAEQEAAAAGVAPRLEIVAPNGIAARLAARRAAANVAQRPGIDRTAAVVGVVDGAYKKFLGLGYEPETARALTQAYSIIELGIVLDGIKAKI